MTHTNPFTLDFTLHLPVAIRPLQAEDLPLLEWFGQYKHFRNLFLRSYQDQAAGKRELLVADVNGFPVGRLFILFYSRNPALADGRERAYLYSFAVIDMLQGLSIGTRLIQAAEQTIRARDYRWITLAVAKDNPGALRLYERHHYRIFAEDEGRWRYTDHRGIIRQVVEPAWLLEKDLLQNLNSDLNNR